MVVTAHFNDDDWQLHKRINNFTQITSHKGEDIGLTSEQCLSDWGIVNVFCITVDNATSNDAEIGFMKRRYTTLRTLLFDGQYLHMRCACHVLNLIVKDGLEELYTSIEGIKNCVKFIYSLSARLARFRHYAILEKREKMACVPTDVPIRWNSTYKMLEVALSYKLVFHRMRDVRYGQYKAYFEEISSKNIKRVGPASDEYWEKASAFVHFLQKFYDTTLKLTASKTPTSQLIFIEMVKICLVIKKAIRDDNNATLKKVATLMKPKFLKYWEYENLASVNMLVYVAHVLNPRWKL